MLYIVKEQLIKTTLGLVWLQSKPRRMPGITLIHVGRPGGELLHADYTYIVWLIPQGPEESRPPRGTNPRRRKKKKLGGTICSL